MTKFKAWAVRTAWTIAANTLGAVSGSAAFSIAAWKAAALAGLSTLIGAALIFARAQADALPEVAK